MLIENSLVFLFSFAAIWVGARLIISSVDKFSKKLRLSAFSLSFFVLGILTSIPEFAVGLTAISEGQPEIFIGNLIGGVAVIFLLIIPVLAVFGNGIKLNSRLNDKILLFSFVTILAPAFMVINRKVSNFEGTILIGLYLILFYFIEKDRGILDNNHTGILHAKSYSFMNILKTLLGIGLVFISSNIIVDKTLYFANTFNISPFFVSLILLSIGTNLPELSIAVSSIVTKNKEIAFGDYLGSAAANTFLFGLFTILSDIEVITADNFILTFILIAFGLALFYYFSRSKRDISRKEGVVLLALYLLFVLLEMSPF